MTILRFLGEAAALAGALGGSGGNEKAADACELDPTEYLAWCEPRSRRRHRRWPVFLDALFTSDGTSLPCTVSDISPAGARIKATESNNLAVGKVGVFTIEGFPPIHAEVRHVVHEHFGVRFLHDETQEVALARFLMAAKPARRLARRDAHIHATLDVDGRAWPCVVTNISAAGAAVMLTEAVQIPISSEAVLTVAGCGTVAAVVRHVSGDTVGLLLTDSFDCTSGE